MTPVRDLNMGSKPDANARHQDTIIVGAGIAGLACARRLHDCGHPFIVISPDVGGRIERSPDGTMNLGAYYVRSDYTHVNRYVQLGRRLDRIAIRRHDAAGNSHGYWSPPLVLHMPQVARFLRLLISFRRRYTRLKERTLVIGQAAAVRSDPSLSRLYYQPATEFIAEHRLYDLARLFIEPGVHGTAFTGLQGVNAFTMLLAALPILLPTYEFTPRLDRLTAGFEDRIVIDSVISISAHADGYFVTTETHGQLIAPSVVVATPTGAAMKLLGRRVNKRSIQAHMFQVEGELRQPYARAEINFFAATDDTLAIARQANGAVLVSSRLRQPDFDRYFASWRVAAHRHWNPAFHIGGHDLVECEQGPNLFLAGDHNIVGLEDSYLTGLYAADRVIESARNRLDRAVAGRSRAEIP